MPLTQSPSISKPAQTARAKSGRSNAGTKAKSTTRSKTRTTAKLATKLQTKSKTAATSKSSQPAWCRLTDEKLLDVRICDLGLKLEDSPVVDLRDQLYGELKERNLKIRPHCWLSDEWFSPDGIPGIAVPFYLAHPRLKRLERNQMLEVEGGTREWGMKIFRHEAGHAIDTAWRLHRRKRYRDVFGSYSMPYPDHYRPKPRSKSYVLHLEPWYAQSHPAEDFAETFAVWLKPKSRWRKEYNGWKALKKVEYIDELMGSISGNKPKVTSRAKVDPIHRIRRTLREYYEDRRSRYSIDCPSGFDIDLKKIFSQTPETRRSKTAAAFLRKNQAEFIRTVAQWTSESRYNVNVVLGEMIDRCRVLKLHVASVSPELKQSMLILLTVQTMRHLHRGQHRIAL